MVTLDTLLIASCISYGGGVLTTVGFGLLVALIRNTREKDDEQFAIPLSSLMGGGGGPGGGPVSVMDMYRASQAAAQAAAQPPPPDSKKKDDDKTPGGNYI